MNVVQLRRNQASSNADLVRALERALQEVKAGRTRSGVIVLRDARGQEHILTMGLYEANTGALSNLGFKLQSIASFDDYG